MISLFLDYIIIILRCWTPKPSLPAQFVLSLSSLYPGSHLHSTHFVQRESMLQLKKHFPKMQYLECWIHSCTHPPLSTLHNFCFFAIKRKEDKNIKGSLRFSYIGRRALGTFNKFKFRYIRCTYHLHRITGIFGWEIIFGKLLKIWAVVCDDAIPSPPPPSRVYNILRNRGYLPFTQTTLAQILCINLTI